MKKIIVATLAVVEKAEKYFITAGLIFISLLVFLQVVLRYVFNTGILGSDEVARFLFVFITWIGASLSVKEKEHINITILSDLLPNSKKFTDVFSTAVCLAMCAFLIVSGLDMIEIIQQNKQMSPVLKVPMAAAYAIIPLSAFLMGVKYIRQFIGEIRCLIKA